MLDSEIKNQLITHLNHLQEDIVIQACVDNNESSLKMRDFLTQIADLSDKITYNETGESPYTPSFQIINKHKNIDITFAMIPMGHEFSTFVLALLNISGHPMQITDKQTAQIKSIIHPLYFTSYISLDCPNCPDIVHDINIMAILNKNVHHTIVAGEFFLDEVRAQNITSIPTLFLNDKPLAQGKQSLDDIFNLIGITKNVHHESHLPHIPLLDVAIIGAGPAGVSAGIYSARKGLKTGIIADQVGGQTLQTLDINNFIGMPTITGGDLSKNFITHLNQYDIHMITPFQVAKIVKNKTYFTLTLNNNTKIKAKTIIIATGANWKKLNIPGEEQYMHKGIAFCPHCDGPLYKNKNVAVIGGGNSGAEGAIDLSNTAKHVTLFEQAPTLLADKILQEKIKKINNISVITNAKVIEFKGDNAILTEIIYQGKQGDQHTLEINGAFIQIGLAPNTKAFKNLVNLNKKQEIIIDKYNQTSTPGIYAAGDATNTPYKQITIAIGEGAKASLSAFNKLN